MNKKELFEATNQEPEAEQGHALMNHINDILEPFKEIGQIEWAVETIVNTCDSALEPYRRLMHTKECYENRTDTGWECICDFKENEDGK